MPYQEFLDAARAERYDIELLGTAFEQASSRSVTASPVCGGAEACPFTWLNYIAGNISKRFTASGLRFAGTMRLARWNVHKAFTTRV